jgi:hypothetical protein
VPFYFAYSLQLNCPKSAVLATGGIEVNEKEQKRYEKRDKRTQNHKNRYQKREIENLMGVHDPIYERHNHAVRRKGR